MKIPDKVKVGGIIYNVKITDAMYSGRQVTGECDDEEGEIRIRGNHPDYMWVTFLHELFHAICFFRGIPQADHDEREIESLAQALAMVIRDNPGLLGGDTDAGKTS